MNLLDVVLYLALVGFLVWVILQIPMPAPFKNIIIGVVCFALVVYVLQVFGLIHPVLPMRLR